MSRRENIRTRKRQSVNVTGTDSTGAICRAVIDGLKGLWLPQ